MAHNIKPGVATGDQVQEIFRYAKEKSFALPAVNVTGSSTINGVLETAAKLNSPVIIHDKHDMVFRVHSERMRQFTGGVH